MPSFARLRAAVALAFLALVLPVAVFAADVPRLAGAVTDQTGVLDGTGGATGPAINRLKRDHAVDLWVLFVKTTGASPVTAYAGDVAALNSLGVNDVLLVVATDDRTDALWVSDGLDQIATTEIDQILSTRVEPRLAAGDPAGAIVGAADGIGNAAGPIASGVSPAPSSAVTPAPTPAATSPGGAPAASGSGGIGILPVILIVAVFVGGFLFIRRRRGPAGTTSLATATGPAADLERQGNSLLIETDDAVRDADQELGFVEAQFGAAEAAGFRGTQTQAAEDLRAAFTARQQLDDATPDSKATRDTLLTEIVKRCQHANTLLADLATRISALRDVEKTAPDLAAALPAQIANVKARFQASQTTVAGLNAFAPATWQTVSGNIPEAGKRLDFADGALTRAAAALAAGDRGTAASNLRQVQTAIAEAGALLDAIDHQSASLIDVRDRLPAQLATTTSAVATARGALTAATSTPDLAARMADAERLLAAARTEAGTGTPDVLAANRDATAAAAAAETVLAGANAELDRATAREAVLHGAVQGATDAIVRASDFITTRRGAVGMVSRTRLAEAQRQLADSLALATVNPAAALTAAQRSVQVADEALQLAGEEFAAFERSGAVGAGPTTTGGPASATADLGSGGGWGGTGWGTPTPSGGFPDGVGTGWGGLRGRARGGRW